jgi:uncharacterized protein involved in exopolysaccharide biosynthesis
VTSRDVAESVVNTLKLDQIPPVHHGVLGTVKGAVSSTIKHVRGWLTYGALPTADKHEVAVQTVQHALLASQVKTSYVLAIAAVWSDPQIAADISNAAADALVSLGKKRYDDLTSAYEGELKAQVDKAAAAQGAAQQALGDYQAAHHITDVTVQLQLSAQNRSSLQQQADGLAAQLSSLRAQLNSTVSSLASTPTTSTSTQDVATGRSSTRVNSTQPNSTYQTLTAQAAALRAQIDGLTAQRAAIVGTLSSTAASATPLTAAQTQLARLALTSNVTAQNFSTLSAQYQQALLNSGQNTVETLHIDRAAPPVLPMSPIRYLYLLIGLVLGALLSFLIVHGRVLRRARDAALLDDEPADIKPADDVPADDAPRHVNIVDLVDAEASAIPVQVPSVNGHAAVSRMDNPPSDSSGG